MPFSPRILFLVAALGLLSACENPEERAERYYQSALSLLEEDDVDRALVELRNVFTNDGYHKDARLLYANLVLERGELQEAYSQYLLLIEQYPDTPEVRRKLASLALDAGNWQEVERHGTEAIEAEPDLPENKALAVALEYRAAAVALDDPGAAAAAEKARVLLEEAPDLIVARRVLIDWLMRGPDPSQALDHVNAALEQEPSSQGMHMARLQLLVQAGDTDAVGEQLRLMYERFPEDEDIPDMLISWYLSQQQYEDAESFLRDVAGPDDGEPEGHLTVVQFLAELEGPEAAEAELRRLMDANAGTDLGRSYAMRVAALRFDRGEQAEAIAEIETIIETGETTDLRHEAKLLLSRIAMSTGDPDRGNALVDEVLAEDATNVDALKSRAARRIRQDETGPAIGDLRSALNQDPRDSAILLLLAEAQQKSGNIELAQQRLAQAVDASGRGPNEVLIYARFLLGRNSFDAAEQVLTDGFRTNPGNLEIAGMLGDVFLRLGKTGEARNLLQVLTASQDPQAAPLARSLQAALLFSQNQIDESLAYLEQSADADANEVGTALQMLRIQVMSGRIDEARALLEDLKEDYPDAVSLRVLEGNLLAIEGRQEDAIDIYRGLYEETPETLIVVERLHQLLLGAGKIEEADTLLAEALERQPDARSLRLLKALQLERDGDAEAAIAIYEGLYEENSGDAVVANNLASLLSVHRDDPEDLERAYVLARRLTGTQVPAFLDTLGWVQVRLEDYGPAITNLQAAARGLPNNPTVAFNLGLAYAAAGRTEAARDEIERGLELGGEAGGIQRTRAIEFLESLAGQ